MTAAQLQEWRGRREHSLATGAQALGVSRKMFARYLSGESAIPRTVALLCSELDLLAKRPPRRLTPR